MIEGIAEITIRVKYLYCNNPGSDFDLDKNSLQNIVNLAATPNFSDEIEGVRLLEHTVIEAEVYEKDYVPPYSMLDYLKIAAAYINQSFKNISKIIKNKISYEN